MIDNKILNKIDDLKYLKPINLFKRSKKLNAIYSVKEFRGNIIRECDLADRYNRRFSLALFEIGYQNEDSISVRRLVRTLYKRFRNIDELGWYSDRQIGVILPYTPSEGAWKLAENICALISSISEPPPFTIYTYPSEKWPSLPKKIWGFINLFNWIYKLRKLRDIYTDNNFREILALERARSDRGNNIFSIIVFEIGAFGSNNENTRSLINKLYRRIRIIDKLGWYDNQHIAIILPYTSFENAHKTAKTFCEEAGITQPNCYTINTYPSHWVSRKTDDPIENSNITISSDGDSSAQGYPSIPSETNGDGNTKSVFHPVENQTQTQENPSQDFSLYQCPKIPFWKRPLDITGAIAGLILFSPVMLAIAFAIKRTSKGPVIFTQKRAGLGGKPFDFYKFRSMDMDADARKKDLMAFNERTGPVFKMTDDPRITPVGKFIRKTSLDELPQFYNVLKGDMSLVGPRPLPVDEDRGCEQWHRIRRDIKPGITCLWQVESRSKGSFDDWVRLDIEYARKQSLLLDLKILALTVPAMIVKRTLIE